MIQIDFTELLDYARDLEDGKKIVEFEGGFRDMVKALTKVSKVRHRYKNRTGVLSNSLKQINFPSTKEDYRSQIASDVNYASYIYEGTKRHFVKPKDKKALAWSSSGQMYFSRGHWVSGITAEPWIENEFNNNEERYLNLMVKRSIKK